VKKEPHVKVVRRLRYATTRWAGGAMPSVTCSCSMLRRRRQTTDGWRLGRSLPPGRLTVGTSPSSPDAALSVTSGPTARCMSCP
jgi:hypothetical protein